MSPSGSCAPKKAKSPTGTDGGEKDAITPAVESAPKTPKKSKGEADASGGSSKKKTKKNEGDGTPLRQGGETDTPNGKKKQTDASGPETDDDGQKSESKESETPLSKSTRLKGYITILVTSAINCQAAYESDAETNSNDFFVPASPAQRRYAQSVAIVNGLLALFCVVVHFDRLSCFKKIWLKLFKPKSKFELCLLLFLVIWNVTATGINTSVRGIAGDGKGQYNLYFSTWIMCWTSFWTLERWIVSAGLLALKNFMKEWPYRAPGWIALLIFSFADLMCVVDLYLNWEEGASHPNAQYLNDVFESVSDTQWQWLLFITSFTIPLAAGFSFVEVFRATNADGAQNTKKSDRENTIEGLVLFVLVCAWIPTVTIATTPGGAASLVGNAYFFTWGCTVVVIETLVWWMRDWRRGIHEIIKQQEEEYKRAKLAVLAQSKGDDMDDSELESVSSVDQTDKLRKSSPRKLEGVETATR